jgi:hypothetical protein
VRRPGAVFGGGGILKPVISLGDEEVRRADLSESDEKDALESREKVEYVGERGVCSCHVDTLCGVTGVEGVTSCRTDANSTCSSITGSTLQHIVSQ